MRATPTDPEGVSATSCTVTVHRVALAVVGALGALALAGCGTPSPDLFVVERTGTVPGARLNLLVSDGTVRCNDGEERPLSSEQLLEARDLTDDLLAIEQADVADRAGEIFSFRVQTEAGAVRFGDMTTRPAVLPRLVRFVREVARGVCGLAR